MLLVVAIFALAGALSTTQASTPKGKALTQASTCSSSLVSTPFCDEMSSLACKQKPSTEVQKQVQGAVIVANSQKTLQTGASINAVSMPQLNSQYAANTTQLDSEKIFSLVNQYRASQGLSSFEKDDKVCELAKTRSQELVGEIANGSIHSGLYNRDLPYWIWENAKVGSNEEGTVAWWLSSPVHHQSIVGDYKYSCVQCTGSYCSELFTSFAPKNIVVETPAPVITTTPSTETPTPAVSLPVGQITTLVGAK